MDQKEQYIANWLEKLQRESWNLELLISGFSIFLLFQGGELIGEQLSNIQMHYNFDQNLRIALITILGMSYLSTYALAINLLFHIFLRGFWIGAIGLRSVQGRIDFDQLNYSPFFTKKLKGKIQNLDGLLIRLDTICSVIFSFTFLIVFMLISLAIWFVFLALFIQFITFIESFLAEGWLKKSIEFLGIAFALVYSISGLIYLIDTLSLGFFKKFRRTSKLFYPIYVFTSGITLSWIYRGIYYTLISRFSKNKIRLSLVPYLLIAFFTPFLRYDQYQFFPDNYGTSTKFYSNQYDNRRGEDSWIHRASISNDIIQQKYIPLFVRYEVRYNDVLQKLCTDYQPAKQSPFISGIKWKKGLHLNDPYEPEESPEKLLACLSSLYHIYLNDSLLVDLDYYFMTHPNKNEKGIYTVINTKNLPSGKNIIHIKLQTLEKDSLVESNYSKIPFWLEK